MIALVLSLIAAQIRYPGQYPPYPYPGGRSPTGGPGVPAPRRSKKGAAEQKAESLQRAAGYVTQLSDHALELDASDHRIITFKVDDKTSMPKGLKVGDYVEITAKQDDQGLYTAATVQKATPPAGQAQPASAGQSATAGTEEGAPERSSVVLKPDSADDPDELARPKLKRGIPHHPKQAKDEEQHSAPNRPPAPLDAAAVQKPAAAEAALMDNARRAAASFISSLPNYIVQEYTTRYVSDSRPVRWKAQDVVSAEVVYEDGRERYEKIAINGKPTKNPEQSGAWSTGEFGTILEDLFSPATAAQFTFVRSATAQRRDAALFDFTVERSHSHWTVRAPGQYTRPAYKGSVWIDRETARVLRLEMEAVEIPKDFPEDTIEAAVDYDFITLGTQTFLLPVRGAALSCQRGSSVCERNVIEFRNYRKFAGQSTVTFENQ